jgi:DNA (cytosine-5)-methyltransferase 1
MGKQGHSPAYRKLDQPMQTITADGRPVLIEPDLRPFILNRNGENGSDRIHDPDKPLPTATTRGAGYLVTPEARPFIVQNRIRPDGDRIFDIDKPVMTVTGHGAGALIEPMMVKYYGTADVTPVDLPLPSITTKGRFGLVDPILVEVNHEGPDRTGSVNKPLKTITSKRGTAIVSPFVVAWDNSKAHGDQVWSAEQPIPTIVTKANKGILMPIIEAIKSGQVDPRRLILIDGIPYMLDILFRMISNPELAKAMSFTNEEFTYEFVGTGEDITRQIGNAVPVETAKALVKVIL